MPVVWEDWWLNGWGENSYDYDPPEIGGPFGVGFPELAISFAPEAGSSLKIDPPIFSASFVPFSPEKKFSASNPSLTFDFDVVGPGSNWSVNGDIEPQEAPSIGGFAKIDPPSLDIIFVPEAGSKFLIDPPGLQIIPEHVEPELPSYNAGSGGGAGGFFFGPRKRAPEHFLEEFIDFDADLPSIGGYFKIQPPDLLIIDNLDDEEEEEEMVVLALRHFGMLSAA
jgi:hypothetical protein